MGFPAGHMIGKTGRDTAEAPPAYLEACSDALLPAVCLLILKGRLDDIMGTAETAWETQMRGS
jgi:hypothetical protein